MTPLEKELLAALKEALEDINWMCNNEAFLSPYAVKKYYDTIAKAEAQEAGDE